jgi:DNA-binding CsgD family transcriptional regulator
MKDLETSWSADSATHWEIGGNLNVNRSKADFFPKTVELQKRIGAAGFVIAVNSRALNSLSPLKVIMSNSSFDRDENANVVLESLGPALSAHVNNSPNPVYWTAGDQDASFITSTGPAKQIDAENAALSGLAFPVHLGGKQSGLAIYFSPSIKITREMLIDIHRKVFVILRELLKIEMLARTDSVSINNRETECLQYAGNGLTSDEISEMLNLSVHTVNAHLSSATTKLDSVNRIQAIAKAIRLGLIT